jgi:hypothetical protein
MPALPQHALDRRDVSAGRTFSIIFAVIAFLVILGCLLLVVILPKLRKKVGPVPGSRYPIVPNYPHPFGPPPRFPSHPALLRGFRKQRASPIQRYNPRVESPFPNSATQLSPVGGTGQSATYNHGLFTPPHYYPACRRQKHDLRQANKPRAAREIRASDPRQFTTFSAKHDYILPVPEPLALKARPAGRPPPLTRQLERFPMPMPLSAYRNMGLVHPVKLFQELEQRHSDTTTETLGTPCPAPQKSKQPAAVEMSLMNTKISNVPQAEDTGKESYTSLTSEPSQNLLSPFSQSADNAGADISDKVEGANLPGLKRMGTLTRPKTPVTEICRWFDRAASDSTSKQLYTPASNPFTTPGFTSTPPSSPGSSAKKVPLPPTRSGSKSVAPHMDLRAHTHRRTPSSVILPSIEKLDVQPAATPSKRPGQTKKGSSQDKGAKGQPSNGRLKLVSWSKLRSNVRSSRRYSASSLSTIFRPILGSRSQYSQGASSIYSRDARHLSFLEAIDLPVKGKLNDRVEREWSTDLRSAHPCGVLHNHSASIDHVKTKIDDWDLHIADLDKPVMLPTAVKRSVSDTGPRRGTEQGTIVPDFDDKTQYRSVPLIQIGRSSDDVFGIEADGFHRDEANMVLKRMAIIGEPQVSLGEFGRGTAPGGGDWI